MFPRRAVVSNSDSADRVEKADVDRELVVGLASIASRDVAAESKSPRGRVCIAPFGTDAEEADDHRATIRELAERAKRCDAVLVVAEVRVAPPAEQSGVERAETPQVEASSVRTGADVGQLFVRAPVDASALEGPCGEPLDERT